MGYVGSYIWKMRQKIGHDEMMSASTDVMAIRDGKVCMVFNKDCQAWCFPGGHAELGMYWQSAARKELFEEAGITAEDEDLMPMRAYLVIRLFMRSVIRFGCFRLLLFVRSLRSRISKTSRKLPRNGGLISLRLMV